MTEDDVYHFTAAGYSVILQMRLVVFFILAYAISWLIWLPLYGPHVGITGLPVLPYHHALGAFGPLLAAAVMHRGEGTFSSFAKGFVRVGNVWYLLVALLSPFVLLVAALLAYGLVSGTPAGMGGIGQSKEFPEFGVIGFTLYNIFTFGFGEEAGWRGYALPKLQQRYSPLTATLVLTVFWAAWHIPLFLYRPGYTGMDVGGIAGWVFSLLTGSVLLTWLFRGSKQSILVCAVFHATIDVAFTSAVPPAVNGYIGFAITVWGIITAWWLYKQKQWEHKLSLPASCYIWCLS